MKRLRTQPRPGSSADCQLAFFGLKLLCSSRVRDVVRRADGRLKERR
jgi:hypothetical protein